MEEDEEEEEGKQEEEVAESGRKLEKILKIKNNCL